jgi:hypothetical protein
MNRAVALIAAAAAVAGGCSSRHHGRTGPGVEPLTLCVQNDAQGYGNVIARAGPIRFDVMPGKEVCKRVPETGPRIELAATSMGGGAAGPLSLGTILYPTGSRCWRWHLTSAQASQSDVTPCD